MSAEIDTGGPISCSELQRLLLSSADHLYLTHERSFDNKTYLQQIEKIVTETGICRY